MPAVRESGVSVPLCVYQPVWVCVFVCLLNCLYRPVSIVWMVAVQAGFPSTVFTVVRTVQKLVPPAPVASSQKRILRRAVAKETPSTCVVVACVL